MRCRDAWAALCGVSTHRHALLLQELWPSGPITRRQVDEIGGSPIAFLAAHFANTILTEMPPRPATPVIVEIGAGSGYLTHFLVSALAGSRAYIIDLPEVLAQSHDNLKRLGSADRVGFIAASDADRNFPRFDIAVNTASMQEMLPETIEGYFAVLRQHANAGAVFYCCNRVEKWLSTDIGNSDGASASRDIPVRFTEYPWQHERDLFFRVSQIHRRLGMEPCQERMIEFAG